MKQLFKILFLLSVTIGYAQFSSVPKIITNTSDGVRWIAIADIDGDGLNDVVAANRFGSNVSWYKNNGTDEPFIEHEIEFLNQTIHVNIGDLDSDGDMDILAISTPDEIVVWYENLDGLGTFSSQKIISNTAIGVFFVFAADVDGDEDLDILSGGDGGKIEWFENIDGLGNFGVSNVIDDAISNSRSLALADMDGDTFPDLVTTSSGSTNLWWYKNQNGMGDFGTRQAIGGNGSTASHVLVSDINGDDFMDVIGVYGALEKVIWHENLDGLGNFGNENIISSNDQAWGIFSGDLDNDNDIDIVTSTTTFRMIQWYENMDGMGTYSSPQIIDSNLTEGSIRCAIADMDNDGDMDIISAMQLEDTIVWYENQTILGQRENVLQNVEVYPNPSDTALFIKGEDTTPIASLQLNSIRGAVLWQSAVFQDQVDISFLQTGVYFLELITDSGSKRVFKIVKQ